jgi:hypothetical protein
MRPTRLVPASSAAEMEKTPPVKIQPPPFQRRIETDEIVALGAVRRVEEFGEDQKREKQHGEESGEGPGEAGERHREREHEQWPPHDEELDDWRVLLAGNERHLHMTACRSEAGEKGQKQNHAEGGAGGGSDQMPLARIAPVPQRPGTDERRLERKHPSVGRKGEAAP